MAMIAATIIVIGTRRTHGATGRSSRMISPHQPSQVAMATP